MILKTQFVENTPKKTSNVKIFIREVHSYIYYTSKRIVITEKKQRKLT